MIHFEETFSLDEKELIKLGGKLFRKGEFDQALRCYNEAVVSVRLTTNPDSVSDSE